MDAYLSFSQNRENSFDPPPVLIAADSDAARARARRTVAMAGWRVADVVGFVEARDRIRRQISASALWIELEREQDAGIDALLDTVATDIPHRRYSAVVAAPAVLLDQIGEYALETGIEIIVDAGDAERMAALSVAVSQAGRDERVLEVSTDKSAARLRQLSEEVNRIAATLARLSAGPSASPLPRESALAADAPPVSAETVRSVIRARRLRARYFPEDLFGDPAWDMLLDLLQAEISQLRVPVSSLCIAAAVPATTALRWIKTMVEEKVFVRRADPHDGRRVFVELAPETSQAMRRYFAELGQVAVI